MSSIVVFLPMVVVAIVLWQMIAARQKQALAPGIAGGVLGISGTIDCNTLLQRGVAARGILLKVGTQRSSWGDANQGYYEVRAVTIDVEIPGKRPYQCDCALFVPANLRPLVLPGATIELRVDPGSKKNVAVYGPGVGLSAAGYQ